MATGSEQLKRVLEVGDDESNKRAKYESNESNESNESVASDDGYESQSHATAAEEMGDNTLAELLESDNRRNSPLLKLPGELRNQIYSYFALFKSISGVMPTSEYRLPAHVSRQLRTELSSHTQTYGILYIECEDSIGCVAYFGGFPVEREESMRRVIINVSKLRYPLKELTVNLGRITTFLQPFYRRGILRQIIVRFAQDLKLFGSTRDRPAEVFKTLRQKFGDDVIREEDADWYPEEAEYKGEETDEEETDEAENEKMEIDWATDWESDEEDSDWHLDTETEDIVNEETEKETEV